MTPRVLNQEEKRMPRQFKRVIAQKVKRITEITQILLLIKEGATTQAKVVATKDRITGYQATLCTHCIHMLKNPHLSPRASLTHTQIPPDRGQPVASSAETRAQGTKKNAATIAKKKRLLKPNSEIRGKLLKLSMIETFIIARIKTLKTLRGLFEGIIEDKLSLKVLYSLFIEIGISKKEFFKFIFLSFCLFKALI